MTLANVRDRNSNHRRCCGSCFLYEAELTRPGLRRLCHISGTFLGLLSSISARLRASFFPSRRIRPFLDSHEMRSTKRSFAGLFLFITILSKAPGHLRMNGPGLQTVLLVDLGYDQTRAASWRGRCRVLHRHLGGTQWRQRPHSIHANGSILPVVVCVFAHRNCKRRIYPSRGKESRFSAFAAVLSNEAGEVARNGLYR